MGLSIHCVWCSKPLVDVEHAKKHVSEQCEVAPWAAALKEASRLLTQVRPDYCRATCPVDAPHEATCADVRAWLAAHPYKEK